MELPGLVSTRKITIFFPSLDVIIVESILKLLKLIPYAIAQINAQHNLIFVLPFAFHIRYNQDLDMVRFFIPTMGRIERVRNSLIRAFLGRSRG